MELEKTTTIEIKFRIPARIRFLKKLFIEKEGQEQKGSRLVYSLYSCTYVCIVPEYTHRKWNSQKINKNITVCTAVIEVWRIFQLLLLYK